MTWPPMVGYSERILYSGKLSREKAFMNFAVLEPRGVPYPPMIDLAFRESILCEMVTSYRSVKVFSLEKFQAMW